MPQPQIQVVFLWHMHQPYYKDLLADTYRLPWVRLHALKDYYGMVAMLKDFPRAHMTFNLVPSLLLQLEDYASGTAREPMQQLAFRRTEELSSEDRLFILRYFFHANPEHLIARYPRYRELFDLIQANEFNPERALPFFGSGDFTDLQVLSQLAWVDETFHASDPEVQRLVGKVRDFDYLDQSSLYHKQQQMIARVFDAYRTAAECGQIEISTSPFYHPILPLLCDTNIATEAHPWVRLPQRRFRHPEDARLQLQRALELHQRVFGRTPQGLWPSEGSVSEEVITLAAEMGFRWAATDQRILGNSIGVGFYRDGWGNLANADRLYRAHQLNTANGAVRMLFRDQELSDRIGFVYSRMDANEAAADFVGKLKQNAAPLLRQGWTPIVPIILDGENAWEYFPESGRAFLSSLYGMLSDDPQIACATVSEALERHGPAATLPRLAPGSWINANFDIWLGADEDNQAWDRLSEARDFFTEQEPYAAPAQRSLALEELLIAEGSDWNWWYGPEHSTANDADFDALFRSHLANVYHALGHMPPEALAHPIAQLRDRVTALPQESSISPTVDGMVTNYFEWIGAGVYTPLVRNFAMHGQSARIKELYYGRSGSDFFLRLDFFDTAPASTPRKVRIALRGVSATAVVVDLPHTSASANGFQIVLEGSFGASDQPLGEAALKRIFEMRFPLQAVGAAADAALEFQVTLWENGLPRETLPLEGWIAVPPVS